MYSVFQYYFEISSKLSEFFWQCQLFMIMQSDFLHFNSVCFLFNFFFLHCNNNWEFHKHVCQENSHNTLPFWIFLACSWVLLTVWQIVSIKICFRDLIVIYLWQHPTLWLCCPWNLRQFSFHQRTNTSRTPLLSDPWCKKHKVLKFIEKMVNII